MTHVAVQKNKDSVVVLVMVSAPYPYIDPLSVIPRSLKAVLELKDLERVAAMQDLLQKNSLLKVVEKDTTVDLRWFDAEPTDVPTGNAAMVSVENCRLAITAEGFCWEAENEEDGDTYVSEIIDFEMVSLVAQRFKLSE